VSSLEQKFLLQLTRIFFFYLVRSGVVCTGRIERSITRRRGDGELPKLAEISKTN
jgi:hypothetical protein